MLCRERILVDANLPNGFLGRKLAAAEPVHVNLAPIRPRRGTRQGLEFGLQLVGIIGEGFQSLPLDHQ